VLGQDAVAARVRLRWSDGISVPTVLTWLTLLAAGLYLAGFVVAGVLRLAYAYPIEATEDASGQVLRRILQGQPMDGPRILGYVPVIYPPLYFYLSAGVALI